MRTVFSTFPLLVGAALFVPSPLAAQVARLVKDIRTTPAAIPGSQDRDSWATGTLSTGLVVFPAERAGVGFELFHTVGAPRTTGLVKDINPGPSHSWPSAFFNHGNTTFFYATTANEGRELWRTNAGLGDTVLVKDLTPGPASSVRSITGFQRDFDQGTMASLGNTLYLLMPGARGLYKSDGTAAGTALVKQLAPWETTRGKFGGQEGRWAQLINIGGKLFFAADDGSGKGSELWTSDGTTVGTVMVKDINPGTGSSEPLRLIEFQGKCYFVADNGTNGAELWKSDGRALGTVMVKDIDPTTGSPSNFFFVPRAFTVLGSRMLFRATDPKTGRELWVTDGTTAGTTVLDIRSGTGSSSPTYLTRMGNVVLFSASDGVFGTELWKSDGTKNGTVRVSDIISGGGSSNPQNITVIGSKAYFEATHLSFNNYELWETDGTTIAPSREPERRPAPAPRLASHPGATRESARSRRHHDRRSGS